MIETLKQHDVVSNVYEIIEVVGRGATCIVYRATSLQNDFQKTCILKEYAPKWCKNSKRIGTSIHVSNDEKDMFEEGKRKFYASLQLQAKIKEEVSVNETSPLQEVFEDQGTLYANVGYFYGVVMSECSNLSLHTFLKISISICKVIKSYHEHGYLCMDLKPENIFLLKNSQNEIITDLIEFIDFDAITTFEKAKVESHRISVDWCAPEMKQGSKKDQIGVQSDIYTIGEFLFYGIFHRHSNVNEHRGFSRYPYDLVKDEDIAFHRIDVQNSLSYLFKHTLRTSLHNRFTSVDQIIEVLENVCDEVCKQEFVVSKLPIKQNLIGRRDEMNQIETLLKQHHYVYVYGIGGIGKTSIVKQYVHMHTYCYDIILYLNYKEDFVKTVIDQSQFRISTITKQKEESDEEFYNRKLEHFALLKRDKKCLVVLDEFQGIRDQKIIEFMKLQCDMIFVSRRIPPTNTPVVCIEALKQQDAWSLFEFNLERSIMPMEEMYVKKILEEVKNHTLLVILLARQICVSHMKVKEEAILIQTSGYTTKLKERVDIVLEDSEAYARMEEILLKVFEKSNLSACKKAVLKGLSYMNCPISIRDVKEIYDLSDYEEINGLIKEGWLLFEEDMCFLHPVIKEVVLKWEVDLDMVPHFESLMMGLCRKTSEPFIMIGKDVVIGFEQLQACNTLSKYKDLMVHVVNHVPLTEESFILTKGNKCLEINIQAVDALKIYDRMLYIYIDRNDLKMAKAIIAKEKKWVDGNHDPSVLSIYYENLGNYYDRLLDGNYEVHTLKQRSYYRKLVNALKSEIKQLSKLSGKEYLERRIIAYIGLIIVNTRSNYGDVDEIDEMLQIVEMLLETTHEDNDLLKRDYYLTKAFYDLYILYDIDAMHDSIMQAKEAVEKANIIDVDYIDYYIIPIANLYLEAMLFDQSIQWLNQGIVTCKEHGDIAPFARKKQRLETYKEQVEKTRCSI